MPPPQTTKADGLVYAGELVDRDKCRAILEAGEWGGLWRFLGVHEGRYVMQRSSDDQPQALTTAQVLELPVRHFLDLYGK